MRRSRESFHTTRTRLTLQADDCGMMGVLRERSRRSRLSRLATVLTVLGLAIAVAFIVAKLRPDTQLHARASDPPAVQDRAFRPTPTQWALLTVQPVEEHAFRTEFATEGKIGVDEDRSTPIFSPYAGRVIKLLVRPGDTVARGQPLFVVEATDSVQAQNDFMAAVTGINKARAQ